MDLFIFEIIFTVTTFEDVTMCPGLLLASLCAENLIGSLLCISVQGVYYIVEVFFEII